MATPNKNIYEKKHDDVILEALRLSPDNRNEAFRMAEKELKKRFNMDANPNQISSRFYTFIKPKYLDKKGEVKNDLVTSATGVTSAVDLQYSIIRDLSMKMSPEKRTALVRELFNSLVEG